MDEIDKETVLRKAAVVVLSDCGLVAQYQLARRERYIGHGPEIGIRRAGVQTSSREQCLQFLARPVQAGGDRECHHLSTSTRIPMSVLPPTFAVLWYQSHCQSLTIELGSSFFLFSMLTIFPSVLSVWLGRSGVLFLLLSGQLDGLLHLGWWRRRRRPDHCVGGCLRHRDGGRYLRRLAGAVMTRLSRRCWWARVLVCGRWWMLGCVFHCFR